jgi:hypothetical protein
MDKESKKWTVHLGGGHLAILSLPQPKTYSTDIFLAKNLVRDWREKKIICFDLREGFSGFFAAFTDAVKVLNWNKRFIVIISPNKSDFCDKNIFL